MPVEWTQEMIIKMLLLSREGYAFSAIASRLGEGFTRGCIAGKMFRLGVSNNKYKRRPSKPIVKKITPTRLSEKESTKEEIAAGVPLLDLTFSCCRFPFGGFGEPAKLFCGAKSKDGSVYCEEHHARAYMGFKKNKRSSPDLRMTE